MGAAQLPVASLRAAVARELGQVSLRQAAREIGLSPNALKSFVAGSHPRATTRWRLERWIASRGGPEHGPSVSAFVRLMQEVTPDLPPGAAQALGREMSELLLDAYQRQHLPPARWVRELVRHYSRRSR